MSISLITCHLSPTCDNQSVENGHCKSAETLIMHQLFKDIDLRQHGNRCIMNNDDRAESKELGETIVRLYHTYEISSDQKQISRVRVCVRERERERFVIIAICTFSSRAKEREREKGERAVA